MQESTWTTGCLLSIFDTILHCHLVALRIILCCLFEWHCHMISFGYLSPNPLWVACPMFQWGYFFKYINIYKTVKMPGVSQYITHYCFVIVVFVDISHLAWAENFRCQFLKRRWIHECISYILTFISLIVRKPSVSLFTYSSLIVFLKSLHANVSKHRCQKKSPWFPDCKRLFIVIWNTCMSYRLMREIR